MNFEILNRVKTKTYTEEDFYHDLLSSLAGSLYTYMVMLRIAGREQEARLLENARTSIFAARDAGFLDAPSSILQDLLKACWGLDNHFAFLQALRPEEATVLQSSANTALWVANVITSKKDVV